MQPRTVEEAPRGGTHLAQRRRRHARSRGSDKYLGRILATIRDAQIARDEVKLRRPRSN
jgi:hypothetical protein